MTQRILSSAIWRGVMLSEVKLRASRRGYSFFVGELANCLFWVNIPIGLQRDLWSAGSLHNPEQLRYVLLQKVYDLRIRNLILDEGTPDARLVWDYTVSLQRSSSN